MGKYMKKARGAGGAMEAMTQGQLGVRTRARAQAIERIKETTSGNKVSSGIPRTFAPAQISYLELRSRRLEKTVGCGASGKLQLSQKATSSDECPRLSDLTNSDILADDSTTTWLAAVPTGKARRTRRQTRDGGSDENEQLICGFHELAAASLLHGRSLQQWGSRGRTPPSVALSRSNSRSNSVTLPSVANSRSNSRSNSVTRELPTPTSELPPRGILTRNQRRKKNECSHTVAGSDGVAAMDMELDTFCHASAIPASNNVNSCQTRNFDFEVGVGQNPLGRSSFVRDRISCKGIGVSNAVEGSTPSFSVRLSSELISHNEQAAPSNTARPLDMEIEDFFLQAESQQQRRFLEQYNFDPVNDIPVPGRYNWVRL